MFVLVPFQFGTFRTWMNLIGKFRNRSALRSLAYCWTRRKYAHLYLGRELFLFSCIRD